MTQMLYTTLSRKLQSATLKFDVVETKMNRQFSFTISESGIK